MTSPWILDCEYTHIKTILLTQAEIEIGDGLPDIRLTVKCLEALKQAGFEVRREVFLPF